MKTTRLPPIAAEGLVGGHDGEGHRLDQAVHHADAEPEGEQGEKEREARGPG